MSRLFHYEVMLSCVLFCLLSGPFPAAAGLSVPEHRFDAGRVMEGEVIEHAFILENPGPGPVTIREVKPDCGCTTVEFDPEVPPGGRTRIALRMDTSGFSGSVAKHTRVFTDDPAQPMVVLTLQAEVWTPIALSKEYVVFKGPAGKTYSEAIDIRAGMEKPLELEPRAPDLAGKVEYALEEVEKGKHYRLLFTATPGSGDRFHGVLRLKTNYPEKPEIEIRVRAWFKEQG
jgi:hypothetical protein